ncbi:MAG: GntR family transcriptional regulator [Candidatus Gastranaerophilales bacterium]|nr:GntR family transcriptional regulator [Candidatus Gastranaerophilales bacterium]
MSKIFEKQRKISISELPAEIPDMSCSYEPKDSIVKKWITSWILSAVSKKTIKENDILPSKAELSSHLGVSIGTVQNAIRYIEDEGYLKSKQRLGTMISNFTNPNENFIKSVSRREKAVVAIKNLILRKEYKINKTFPSIRKMSEYLDISQNTTRLAYEYLCSEGILESRQVRGKSANWVLKAIPNISYKELKKLNNRHNETLINKITENIKKLLAKNFSIGDKIPSHEELASDLNVSVKTIHECIKQLSKDGIVISRRGRYGCILAQNPLSPAFDSLDDNPIFAQANSSAFYSYKKIESKIIDLINKEYNSGDKLPSMLELSKKFDVSTNTIRKALISISQDGYITFARGKYGGTFVVDKPLEEEKESYQWLSINPEFI